MEVTGRKPVPDLDKGSADATDYCQPCEEGGKRAVAQGFCQTCEEYMCGPCIECHKRLRMSRNHILLSKDKMPSFFPSTKKSAIADTEYCTKHPKEMIKFYCQTHKDLGCCDCVVFDHRICKLDYIADVAKEFVTGNEFRELEQSIKRAKDLLSGFICNANVLFGDVKTQSWDEMDRLMKFQAEINNYLDRRLKKLLDNIQKFKNEDENVLQTQKTDFPAPDLSTVTWKIEEGIDVTTPQEQVNCLIIGSTLLSPCLFLLTDLQNCSVKLVDLTACIVTSHLQLPTEPWDVCVLPDDQAAVTLPEKSMIQLLSTQGEQLSFGKEIKVSSKCHGISFYNNRLYVSYVPRIEVMTLDGHIITTFQTDDGIRLFKSPPFLTVSASTPPTLYVSDDAAHTVFQMSLDGKVLREYPDEKLINPLSVVAVGPGQLLVCGFGSANIMLLTEWNSKMTEILRKNDLLAAPYNVSFCPYTRTIFVGMVGIGSLYLSYAN